MEAFSADDLEKNIRSIQICSDELPVQQSLGLAWDLNSDTLTFKFSHPRKAVHEKRVAFNSQQFV